jgi:alkylhydroperoxidase family enzyme
VLSERQRPTPGDGWFLPDAGATGPPVSGGWLSRFVIALIFRVTKIDAQNLFALLLVRKRLFFGWLAFAANLLPYGRLPRLVSELVVLRVAWSMRCWYEWAQHVTIACDVGMADETISRVPAGPDGDGWDESERAVLRATDELLQGPAISSGTLATLRLHYDAQQIVELVALVGNYRMVANILNSFGVELDEPIASKLRAQPLVPATDAPRLPRQRSRA